jgi:multiple sugar transport system ATP-binding protein
MNFFPATLTDAGVALPFGEATLTDELRESVADVPKPADVIVGVRPEHFEDATLVDVLERIRALTFEVSIDLVESLGAEKYAYFTTGGDGAQSDQLAELAAESSGGGAGGNQFVARLSADSPATGGQKIELALDTAKIHIFDANTGVNLSVRHALGER